MVRIFLVVCTFALVSQTALAAEVVMGFSRCIPPYVFSADNRGIELDIAREALAYRDHTLIPRYYPTGKLPLAFKFSRVDAVMVNFGEELEGANVFYAEPTAVYEDVLISLSRKGFDLSSPDRLADLLVVGFKGARNLYGAWVEPSDNNGLYFESSDQKLQVLGIFRGHFDVMLVDRHIFRYFAPRVAEEYGVSHEAVIEHQFMGFEQGFHRPVFSDETLRDDFNAGLADLKESGRYQEIYNYYLGRDGFSNGACVNSDVVMGQ